MAEAKADQSGVRCVDQPPNTTEIAAHPDVGHDGLCVA